MRLGGRERSLWINGVDPDPTSHVVTLEQINNDERTVYLVEVEVTVMLDTGETALEDDD